MTQKYEDLEEYEDMKDMRNIWWVYITWELSLKSRMLYQPIPNCYGQRENNKTMEEIDRGLPNLRKALIVTIDQ